MKPNGKRYFQSYSPVKLKRCDLGNHSIKKKQKLPANHVNSSLPINQKYTFPVNNHNTLCFNAPITSTRVAMEKRFSSIVATPVFPFHENSSSEGKKTKGSSVSNCGRGVRSIHPFLSISPPCNHSIIPSHRPRLLSFRFHAFRALLAKERVY